MHLDNLIDDFCVGDERRLPYDIEDMDDLDGDSIATVYFTVKRSWKDPDDEALISKTITTDASTDGQVDNPGGGSPIEDAHCFFDFAPEDTLNVVAPHIFYEYEVKAVSSGGAPKAIDGGRILFLPAIKRTIP